MFQIKYMAKAKHHATNAANEIDLFADCLKNSNIHINKNVFANIKQGIAQILSDIPQQHNKSIAENVEPYLWEGGRDDPWF